MLVQTILVEGTLAIGWWLAVMLWVAEVRAGVLAYAALYAIVTSYDSLAGSGAVAFIQLGGAGDSNLALVRLTTQWFSSLFAYGLMRGTFDSFLYYVHAPLSVSSISFWIAAGLQFGVGTMHAVFVTRREEDNEPVAWHWYLLRSGVLFNYIVFPWGCPQLSLVTCLWMSRHYGLSNLFALSSSMMMIIAQALAATLIGQIAQFEEAKIKNQKTL